MAIRTKLDGDDNADFEEGGWLYLEKRSRESGDRRWKATLTEPADSELKHATIFSAVISDHWKSIYSSTSWPLANIKLWWYYTWEKCDWVWISPKMLDVLLHPSKSHHLFSGPYQSVDHKPQDFWNQVSILSDIRRAWLSFISIPLPHRKKIKINNTSIFEHKTKRSSTWSRRPALPSTPSSPR